MEDFGREKVDKKDETKEEQQESSFPENENPSIYKSGSESDFDFEFTCEVCNKTFSGLKSLRQHEKGAKHLKRIQKKEAKKKLFKQLENSTDNDEEDLHQALFAVCKTCKKDFMGPESLEQHLKSSSHHKKIAAAKLLKEIRDSDGQISPQKLKQKVKDQKSKKAIPLLIGATSVHFSHPDESELLYGNNATRSSSGRLMMPDYSSDDEIIAETQEFECSECKKVFTGVNPWYQHLVSKAHEKTLKQKELFDKLKSAEGSFSNDNSVDSYLELEDDDMISCKLCHVALSGPENAIAHLKSRKHSKGLEMKKWKKAMKEKNAGKEKTSKTEKISSEFSIENNSDIKSEANKQQSAESVNHEQKDKNPMEEFSCALDGYKIVSETKSRLTVVKATYLGPSNASEDSLEERSKKDQYEDCSDKPPNQHESSPISAINGSSEVKKPQNKNNLQLFKVTSI